MIDRNKDGVYGGYGDLIIDWVGEDEDGNPAMQVVVDNIPEANRMRPATDIICGWWIRTRTTCSTISTGTRSPPLLDT